MIASLIPAVVGIIDKIIPNKEARDLAKIELLRLQNEGEFKPLELQLQRDIEQIALNKIEAASPSFFKSGWRPSVGWVCVSGLVYSAILYPILTWGAVIVDIPTPPVLDTSTLITLLCGLLGIGTLRTIEKDRGITR